MINVFDTILNNWFIGKIRPICGAGKIKITLPILPIPISPDMNTLEWYYGIVNSLNKVSCIGHIATLIDDFYSLLLVSIFFKKKIQ